MKVRFIVNPVAGRGRGGKVWASVRPTLPNDLRWDVEMTTGPGAAKALAASAAAAGIDRVVVVGGDGTVQEAANGLVGTATALAVVRAGTGNDYARGIGIPDDANAAAQLAVNGRPQAADIGEVLLAGGGRYYLNVAGIGFDAEVAQAVNAYPKYMGGTIPYLFGALKTLRCYRPRPMRITIDGDLQERRVLLIAVAISRYYGGGMLIAPAASLDDGLFDVCIAGDLKGPETLGLLPRVYSGRHTLHHKVQMHRCREIEVAAETPTWVQTDGEVLGQLPATFRICPAALPVVMGRLPVLPDGSP